MKETVKLSDLGLGDEVQLWENEGYGTATVSNVTEKTITLFRPYVHHSDYEHTGGVTCYIGVEEFTQSLSDATIVRLRKGKVR